jgi:hypothetical protein
MSDPRIPVTILLVAAGRDGVLTVPDCFQVVESRR